MIFNRHSTMMILIPPSLLCYHNTIILIMTYESITYKAFYFERKQILIHFTVLYLNIFRYNNKHYLKMYLRRCQITYLQLFQCSHAFSSLHGMCDCFSACDVKFSLYIYIYIRKRERAWGNVSVAFQKPKYQMYWGKRKHTASTHLAH